jgi:hypothetical protein
MALVLGTIAQRSGLVALAHAVADWFADPDVTTKYGYLGIPIPTVTTLGWRQREIQLNRSPGAGANRIAFLDGHGPSDRRTHGELSWPRGAGNAAGTVTVTSQGTFPVTRGGFGTPRNLAGWEREFTLSIWTVLDVGSNVIEEAQIGLADTVLESVVQGLLNKGTGNVRMPMRVYQDKHSVNLTYGIERLVECKHFEPLQDIPNDVITDASPVIERIPPA